MAQPKNIRIGGFEIVRRLSNMEGQGIVYEARSVENTFEDIAIGDHVALKVMTVQDPEGDMLRRLTERTDVLVKIRHPNIVRYYGCFSEERDFNTIHVVVMDYLRGQSLKELLDQNPRGLDADIAVKIIRESLSALKVASEEHKIIHRDIKPGNIFICETGETKLIDFELARQMSGRASVSSQGNLRGSFDYMAPDFIDPEFHGDEQSDIFSLAVCLHEALSGRTPYERVSGTVQQASFFFHNRWMGADPIKISQKACRTVAHAQGVLKKALSRNREERYGSFKKFVDAFQPVKLRVISNGLTQYELLHIVGQGGFGEVFKARRMSDKRTVAIKHLLKPEYASRFIKEAELLQSFSDSRLVSFIDFFHVEQAEGEQHFIVMDFLSGMPGGTLGERLRETKQGLPFEEVIVGFIRFAEGLAILHRREIYHRDIKPSNLYLPKNRAGDACVMDMGVARNAKGTLTFGHVPGTLDFMPPEVAGGASRGDAGMDIYALGLCLYEALTAKSALPRLPPGDEAVQMFILRAHDKQKPIFDHPLVTRDFRLHSLLVRMTDPDALRREQDISKVVDALTDFLPQDSATLAEITAATLIAADVSEKGTDFLPPKTQPVTHPPPARADDLATKFVPLPTVFEPIPEQSHSQQALVSGTRLTPNQELAPENEVAHLETCQSKGTQAEGSDHVYGQSGFIDPKAFLKLKDKYDHAKTRTIPDKTMPKSKFIGLSEFIDDPEYRPSSVLTDKKVSEERPSIQSLLNTPTGRQHVTITNGTTKYEILEYIGRGNIGEVFKARQMPGNHVVAIKHLLKTEYKDCFLREAELLREFTDGKSRLLVPFITSFKSTVAPSEGEDFFLVMDYLPGMPGNALGERLSDTKRGLPVKDVLTGFIRFAKGLAILHRRGVYHCDIKPPNLYLPQDHPQNASLMDLGLAYDQQNAPENRHLAGTLDYMPPEVAFEGIVGSAGMDIYALGLCLYEALTAEKCLSPLPQENMLEEFTKRAADKHLCKPIFLLEAIADLDPSSQTKEDLYNILISMTHPDVSQRETDAHKVAKGLKAILQAIENPKKPITAETIQKVRQMAAAFLVISCMGLSVIGGVAYWPKIGQLVMRKHFNQALAHYNDKKFILGKTSESARTNGLNTIGLLPLKEDLNKLEEAKGQSKDVIKKGIQKALDLALDAYTNKHDFDLGCSFENEWTNLRAQIKEFEKPADREKLDKAKEDCEKWRIAIKKADTFFESASFAYTNKYDSVSGERDESTWIKILKQIGKEPDAHKLAELAKAKEECKRRKETTIGEEKSKREKEIAKDKLEGKRKEAETFLDSLNETDIATAIDKLITSISEANKYNINVEVATNTLQKLKDRLTKITSKVTVTVKIPENTPPPPVNVEWSRGKEDWNKVGAGNMFKTVPGNINIKFTRSDYVEIVRMNLRVSVDDLPVNAPTTSDWSERMSPNLKELISIESLVKQRDLSNGDLSNAVKRALKPAPVLYDPEHRARWVAATNSLEQRLKILKQREADDARRAKVAELVKQINKYISQVDNGNFDALSQFQWPENHALQFDESVKDARVKLQKSIKRWVEEVACVDKPFDSRVSRLAKAKENVEKMKWMDAGTTGDLNEQIKKKQDLFVLLVDNKNDHPVTLNVNGTLTNIGSGMSWTKEIPVKEGSVTVTAFVPTYRDQTTNMVMTAGGYGLFVLQPFKKLHGSLRVVGLEEGDKITQDGKEIGAEEKLPLGTYVLIFTRYDCNPLTNIIKITSVETQKVEMSSLKWVEVDQLTDWRRATNAWAKSKGAACLTNYPTRTPKSEKNREDKEVFEKKLEEHFSKEIEKYRIKKRKSIEELELYNVQLADPLNRKYRTDLEKPPTADALKPPELPEVIKVKFPELKSRLESKVDLTDELQVQEALKKLKLAHEDSYLKKDYAEVLKYLSEAAKSYPPNKYDKELADVCYKEMTLKLNKDKEAVEKWDPSDNKNETLKTWESSIATVNRHYSAITNACKSAESSLKGQ